MWYVVWRGRVPGVYATWEEARAQVHSFSGARYRAFKDRQQAELAFAAGPEADLSALALDWRRQHLPPEALQGYAVDAAWNAQTKTMHYRGVRIADDQEIFHHGPFEDATNNVGEFLAVVEGLDWLKQRGLRAPIYTDSLNAMQWVSERRCNTALVPTARNAELFARVAWAERWLREHADHAPVHKWRTELWGENPADFGRK
jgi:ribonuclease HI